MCLYGLGSLAKCALPSGSLGILEDTRPLENKNEYNTMTDSEQCKNCLFYLKSLWYRLYYLRLAPSVTVWCSLIDPLGSATSFYEQWLRFLWEYGQHFHFLLCQYGLVFSIKQYTNINQIFPFVYIQ